MTAVRDVLGLLFLSALLAACGHPTITPEVSDGGCVAPELGDNPDAGFEHLPIGTTIVYPTNPPAGGDHYPEWATWGEHTDVVPAPYFVHNEEHGGIVLLYNCPQGCPDIVDALRQVMNGQPADPLCEQDGTDPLSVFSRFVLIPDPDLDVPVAAAAWGFYYKEPSLCVDLPSLNAFIAAHYGNGREPLCTQGQYQ